MARIFITGSADGLGQMSADLLVQQGHEVVLHARNEARADHALKSTPKAKTVLIGDLSNFEETKELANKVNALGQFDAVIHNAGVYQAAAKQVFAVNTLAPFVLTCLIQKPKRLIYLSSGMHLGGHASHDRLQNIAAGISYSDSKLHILMLGKAVARTWSDVHSNTVNPGWVATRMGGKHAPDDLQKGFETQSWLAVSDDKDATVSGRYFFHQKEQRYNPIADDLSLQDELISRLQEISGILLKTDWV